MRYLIYLMFGLWISFACAQELEEEEKKDEPPRIGNFSLPSSQQPSGLFAFGGNIIDKDELQLFLFADEFMGKRRELIDVIPSVVYGIRDNLSVLFAVPFCPKTENDCFRARGIEDLFVQFEYAFFNKKDVHSEQQATIIGNMTAPTGSVTKNPATGYGAPSLFIGFTYIKMTVDWFYFTGQAAILPFSYQGTKIGDQFLYQFGAGRSFTSPLGWIYAAMLEVDGQYSVKNRIRGTLDRNSGGNVVYATPSLWISSKNILLQFGVSFPMAQSYFGKQEKFDYALNFYFGWSFY